MSCTRGLVSSRERPSHENITQANQAWEQSSDANDYSNNDYSNEYSNNDYK